MSAKPSLLSIHAIMAALAFARNRALDRMPHDFRPGPIKGFVRRLSKGELGHRRAWLLAKREDRPIERITHGPIARMAVSR